MDGLIKSTLILAKKIYDDETAKNGQRNTTLGNFFTWVYSIKEQDLAISIGVDWSGRRFEDDQDLYRYKLVIEPDEWRIDGWPSKELIRLKYDYDRKLFLSQKFYNQSGAIGCFNDEKMLNHIHEVLKEIAEKRGI